MTTSSCPNCGAAVQFVLVGGCLVPLEVHTDASSDAERYRIIGHNPLRAERVANHAVGDYYPDHRYDCPAHNAGR